MTDEEIPQDFPAADEPVDAELTDETRESLPEMRTEDALRFVMGMFNDLAWVKLGIRAAPSGQTTTDLPQAQLAIDALAALLPLSEGRFEAHEVRDLKNQLSSLQMNYVQRKTAS